MQQSFLSRLTLWIGGLGLFVAAFFLPAVREPPATGPAAWGPGLQSHDFDGWECAVVSSWITVRAIKYGVHPKTETSDPSAPAYAALVALSGWVNPLVLLYLASCAWRKFNRIRPFLAGLIFLCLIAAWIVLAKEHFKLLIGHYLWLAGILVILVAPFVMRTEAASKSQVNS